MLTDFGLLIEGDPGVAFALESQCGQKVLLNKLLVRQQEAGSKGFQIDHTFAAANTIARMSKNEKVPSLNISPSHRDQTWFSATTGRAGWTIEK